MSEGKAKKRGLITFQSPSGRKILSREEYIYWYNFLVKVLKVGTEFEQNLPSAKASLDPKERTECSNVRKGCASSGCVHMEECLTNPHPSLCKTRRTGAYAGSAFACPAKNDGDVDACAKCPAWALDCRKFNCSMFTPFCTVCPDFTRGNSSPENSDIRHDAESVREEMRRLLMPSGFVGEVGSSGALEVTRDNSLEHDGGIEIPTVGRRFHWGSFYEMCKGIIDPLAERGAYVNERAGQHFHVLAGYLPREKGGNRAVSELEKPVPEIIMANLHQLHRRYELAMFWITSCGTSRESLTRWARFRQSIFPFSPLQTKMGRIVQELAEKIVCQGGAAKNGKYASIAYYLSQFDDKGDVSTFHFENRIADGAQSPAVVTAWAALWVAFVLKAVRCSQYGLIDVGNKDFVTRTLQVQKRLIDGGTRGWNEERKADTSHLTPDDLEFLRQSAQEMVSFMKPELSDLDPAYDILESLASRPCSIRLINGENWQKIETDLMASAPNYAATGVQSYVQEIIDLSSITECHNLDEWVGEVSSRLGVPVGEVASVITEMINRGECRWSSPIGSVISAL